MDNHQLPHIYGMHTHTCEQRQRDVDGCLTVGPGEPKGTQTAVRSSGGGRHTGASEETGIRNTSGFCAKLTSKPLVRKRKKCQCARNASNNSLQTLLDRFCLNPRIQLRVYILYIYNYYIPYVLLIQHTCVSVYTSTHICTLCIRTCTYAYKHTTQTHTHTIQSYSALGSTFGGKQTSHVHVSPNHMSQIHVAMSTNLSAVTGISLCVCRVQHTQCSIGTEREATNGALTVGNVHATSVLVLRTCAPVLLKPMHTASQPCARGEGTSLYTHLMSYTV